MERVIAYIDGFNLYYGLKASGWARYYWLDLPKLCKSFLIGTQQLSHTKYFTARITAPEDKRIRQNTYLEALGTLSDLSIIYGRYEEKAIECFRCKRTFEVPNEKMTDVNLAVELLTDAFQDQFDTAYVISGDADLTPPVLKTRQLFPNKKVIIWSPPNRYSDSLKKAATFNGHIGHGVLAKSLLPDALYRADGFILKRPDTWR